MNIITTHNITLYSGGEPGLVLRPLCDEHLPLLYKWNADPELLWWTEGNDVQPYEPEDVHHIFGKTSQSAFCFLIEADGLPIGECWLQRMNIPEVKAMYPDSLDVRRIDMAIGEKAYWNRGIGTRFIGMLVDFAFNGEHADLLHCFCEDYNPRSRRMWEKHGFTCVLEEPIDPPGKGKIQLHYRLTRQEFIQRRRERIPPEQRFAMPIAELQPSQLYISEGKLRLVREWFDPADMTNFDPIPVKRFDGRIMMTDGHTRAVAAQLAGLDSVPAYWDEDALDMRAYAVDAAWCDEAGVRSPVDLAGRVVPHTDFERLWRKRCMEMEL